MKPKSLFIFLLAIALLIPAAASSQVIIPKGYDAKLEPVDGRVEYERKGMKKVAPSFGIFLKQGDVITTGPQGKTKIFLRSGDVIFLAPNAKLTLETKVESKAGKLKSITLGIWGKLRARAFKRKSGRLYIRTANAVIGVKGTEFIVDYTKKITTVGTMEGLVNLRSTITEKEIDIPKGKMSSISASGKVLPLSEFAGTLLEGVEFAGQKLDDDDAMGKRVDF